MSDLRFRLKRFRKTNSYTQKQVADYLGIDRSTYTFYETGTTEPKYATLEKLASLYGVSLDTLVGRQVIDPDAFAQALETLCDCEEEKQLVYMFRDLSPEKQSAIMQLMRAITK